MTSESERTHEVFEVGGAVPVRSWTVGVPFEEAAREQVRRVAFLPFVHKWVAVMPDVHAGKGATVGSVIATRGAVIPAAVGVLRRPREPLRPERARDAQRSGARARR